MDERYYDDQNFFQYFKFMSKDSMCNYLHRLITDGHDVIKSRGEIILLPYFIPIEKLYDIIVTVYGNTFGYDYYEAENLDIIDVPNIITKQNDDCPLIGRYIIEDTDTYHLSCARYNKHDHVVSFDSMHNHDTRESRLKWLSHLQLSFIPDIGDIHFVRGNAELSTINVPKTPGKCNCNLEEIMSKYALKQIDVLLLRNNINNSSIISQNTKLLDNYKPYIEIRFNNENEKSEIITLLEDMGYFIRVGKSIIYACYIPLYN